jgi:hypothetical protein
VTDVLTPDFLEQNSGKKNRGKELKLGELIADLWQKVPH